LLTDTPPGELIFGFVYAVIIACFPNIVSLKHLSQEEEEEEGGGGTAVPPLSSQICQAKGVNERAMKLKE